MGVAGKTMFMMLFLCVIAAGPSFARAPLPVTDSDLDAVHARGLEYLFDANTLLSTGFTSGAWRGSSSQSLSLGNSVTLSGGSQQSGIGVVNAVNSSVNMPINITVLINSTVNGGISLSNHISSLSR